jgi:hypothetical protein
LALGDFIYDPIPSHEEPSDPNIAMPRVNPEKRNEVQNAQLIVNNQTKTNPIDTNTSSTLKDIIAEPS